MSTLKTSTLNKKKIITHEAEKKAAAVISVIFMMTYYILPQYFGLDTSFFDLTAQRIMIIVFFIYLVEKNHGMRDYFEGVRFSAGSVFMGIYLFVLLYTAIARKHVGTILYSLIEFLALFIVVFVVRECLGVKRFIKLIYCFVVFLCILGMVEYVMKRTPFSYIETIKGLYCGRYIRAGYYRIMGPANHALGYGLMLITMAPFVVYDVEKDKISFMAHPVGFALLTINVFLTGSRSSLGLYLFELAIVFIFCSFEEKKKAFIFAVAILAVLVPLVIATSGTSFGRYVLRTFFSVVDQILGTNFAAKYGADVRQLTNSSVYREQLKKLFKVSWLSPFLGQGSQYHFTWVTNGVKIESIDNAYIAMYIRYAYPGMISYILYIITVSVTMLIEGIKKKCGLFLALFAGAAGYFIHLYYVDTLQTIKYAYILFAIFFACYDSKTKTYSLPYAVKDGENAAETATNAEYDSNAEATKEPQKVYSYIKKRRL